MQGFFKILISTFILFTFLPNSKNVNSITDTYENIFEQDADQKNLYVISTELGDITFKVHPKKAPLAVDNFLSYVANNNFKGASFYRVVRMNNQPKDSIKIEVIQGNFIADELAMPSIAHETTETTGILHKNGTISMARMAPGTAAAAFFICINDQPELDYGGKRNPDGQGFTAFGEVTQGMDIVRAIQAGATQGQSLEKQITIHKIHKAQ